MKNKALKITLLLLGAIVLLILLALLALRLMSPGTPRPVTGPDGQPLPRSISTLETIHLGGVQQHLIIRGADSTLPVMLFLHGGPGSPEFPFMKQANPGLEHDFLMVHWEQRGAGKSFSSDIPPESMTLEQMVADTRELSEYLAERFGQDRIYLMGHSWGSLLGILTAHEHPELFHAFLGVGQVAHQYRAERISYDWVIQQAGEREDAKALRNLQELTFPDSLASSDAWIGFLLPQRSYVMKYEGAMRGQTGMWPMVRTFLRAPEYTLKEKLSYFPGNMFSLDALWPRVIGTNLFHRIDSMEVPVYIFQGVHDYQTPYVVARDFYEQLKAPKKAFFPFDHSAHSPLFEEPGLFNERVREAIRGHSD
jgi:pimeloyl-ACP methyl ester carboxylesterase